MFRERVSTQMIPRLRAFRPDIVLVSAVSMRIIEIFIIFLLPMIIDGSQHSFAMSQTSSRRDV